ncbi:hypothetical protein GCM10022409_11980 [Hymenobacter glaciei]|uniref:BioF2-like acetyltransferase domain-containing protein n=1 Tax=Hymenobacter glaciei TaxID=877209 RepID=A0ABP7TPG1_9BACT
MALRLQTAQGAYPEAATDYFDFTKLDAFHHPEVLTVLYDQGWYSVLITDDAGHAFLHSYVMNPLPHGHMGFDIEPFIGYAGPVVTEGSDAEFGRVALASYAEHCRTAGIVAEVVRFNPLLNNVDHFTDAQQLRVIPAKDIVVAECHADDAAQLASFQTKCRSSVKRGQRDCTYEMLDKATEWDAFVQFYYASLQRIGADKKWFYPAELLQRAAQSNFFQVYVVKYEGQWASLSLVIEHPLASYYFAAASGQQPVQGANEFLLFTIAQALGRAGGKWLIMGGGNTASDDDPLLRFKRKFAHDLTPLTMGCLAHDQERLTALVNEAVVRHPELADVRFFLKYRLHPEA